MAENVQSIIPTTFDTELLEQLEAVGVQLQHPDSYFSFIEQHLPLSGSMASGGELLYAKEPAVTSAEWLESIRAALHQCLGTTASQEQVVIVGDNMVHYAYVLAYSQFVKHVGTFFSFHKIRTFFVRRVKCVFNTRMKTSYFCIA